jgi:hypothetical protein
MFRSEVAKVARGWGDTPLRHGQARIAGLAIVILAIAGGAAARTGGVDLGAPTAPFFWAPLLFAARHPWWPLPSLVAAFAGGLALSHARLPRHAFLAGAFALALGARLGLAVAERGIPEWWWPLVRPNARATEYPAAYRLVSRDALGFVDHFAQLVPVLPVHPSGHPVGATLAFFSLQRVTGSAPATAIALCTIGALAVIPTYLLGCSLCDERAARTAVIVFALAPDTLLYGATSYDAAFVPIGALCAWLLVSGRIRTGALVATAAFLVSYALALVPLWAAMTTRGRRSVRIALVCLVTCAATLAILALALGYDPIAATVATRRAYLRGIGGRRPQWYWVVGGPAAFLVMLGPLLAERFLAAVERTTAGARALVACIALAALSGVVEAEVERILQFLVPLAAVAAAPTLRSRRWLAIGLALGLIQAYIIELSWDTTF